MKELGTTIAIEPRSQEAEDDADLSGFDQDSSRVRRSDRPANRLTGDSDELGVALQTLSVVHDALERYEPGTPVVSLPVDHLDSRNLDWLDRVLGTSGISISYDGAANARIQESVFAGVWRVRHYDDDGRVNADIVEVAPLPKLIARAVFTKAAAQFALASLKTLPVALKRILSELHEALICYAERGVTHVMNLTDTEESHLELMQALFGLGPAVIESRGSGNCRITSTNIRGLWWVQFFNTQGEMIVNSLEVATVPSLVSAEPDDLSESADSLRNLLADC
ncbi:MAG: hydrogenase expression/formation C-terminal domain-containing protein [Pseudomonadota bacterium]